MLPRVGFFPDSFHEVNGVAHTSRNFEAFARDGVTGRVACDEEFARAIAELPATPERMSAMRRAAREYALGCSWDAMFEGVVAAYQV
jgi:hypothetical protein